MPTIQNLVAEFKVAHLYPPYEGKGKAKIVSHDGTKYSCEESQLAQFQEGEDVAIYYENESFKSKKDGQLVKFKKFVSKIAKTNGAAPKIERAPASSKDAARYVTVDLAKEFVKRGDTPADTKHLIRLLDMCFDAYMGSKLAGHKAQSRDDMNDEIPEGDWQTNSENPAD